MGKTTIKTGQTGIVAAGNNAYVIDIKRDNDYPDQLDLDFDKATFLYVELAGTYSSTLPYIITSEKMLDGIVSYVFVKNMTTSIINIRILTPKGNLAINTTVPTTGSGCRVFSIKKLKEMIAVNSQEICYV